MLKNKKDKVINMNEMNRIIEFYNELGDQESKDIYTQMYKQLIHMVSYQDWKRFD